MKNKVLTIPIHYIKFIFPATVFVLLVTGCDSKNTNTIISSPTIKPIMTETIPSIPKEDRKELPAPRDITPTTAPAALFYYSRAFRLLEMELWDESIVAFGPVIAMLPNMPHGFHGRGIAYMNKNVVGYARSDFENAIKIDPEYGPVYIDRARLHIKENQLSLATQDLQKALKFLHPIRHEDEINSAQELINEIQSQE